MSQIFGVRPVGACLQLLPLPTPIPTPTSTPTPQCFANMAQTQPCGQGDINPIPIGGGCPPTIISISTPLLPAIFGCQSGQFSTFTDPTTDEVFLQIPPNCAGCYKIDLHISGTFAGDPLPARLFFGVCRSEASDFITPVATFEIVGTVFNVAGQVIPFSVSTSGNVCLQVGDLIVPCATGDAGSSVDLGVSSFSLNIVRLGAC